MRAKRGRKKKVVAEATIETEAVNCFPSEPKGDASIDEVDFKKEIAAVYAPKFAGLCLVNWPDAQFIAITEVGELWKFSSNHEPKWRRYEGGPK